MTEHPAAWRPPPRTHGFALAVLGMGLLGVVFGLGSMASHGFDAGLIIVLGGLGLIALSVPMLTSPYSLAEPLTFITLIFLVGLLLKSIYIVYAQTHQAEAVIRMGRTPEYFIGGAFWTAVGLAAMSFGYMITRARIRLERVQLLQAGAWSPWRVGLLVAVFGVVALISTVMYVRLMGVQFTSLDALSSKRRYYIEGAETEFGSLGYLIWGARMAEYAFYLALVALYASRRRLVSLAGAGILFLGLLAMVVPFVSNSRQSALLVLVNAILLTYFAHGRINVRSLALGAAAGIALLMTLTALRRDQSEELFAGQYSEVSAVLDETVGSRHFSDFSRTTHILHAVPDKMDYQWGGTMIRWVYAPVPRAIWKEKPFMGVGKQVAADIFGYTDRRGVPPGLLGELILNFGAAAIPFGMFLFGVLLKVFYLSFMPVLRTAGGALLYVSLVYPMTFTFVNNEVSMAIVRLILTAAPMVVALLFVRVSTARASLRPQPGVSLSSLSPA